MSLTAAQLAAIALDWWRNQPTARRTPEQLRASLYTYAATYYGPETTWNQEVRAVVAQAEHAAAGQLRPHERPRP